MSIRCLRMSSARYELATNPVVLNMSDSRYIDLRNERYGLTTWSSQPGSEPSKSWPVSLCPVWKLGRYICGQFSSKFCRLWTITHLMVMILPSFSLGVGPPPRTVKDQPVNRERLLMAAARTMGSSSNALSQDLVSKYK